MKSLSLLTIIVLILCSVQCAGQQVTPQKPNGLKKFNKAKYSELNEKNSLKYTENDTIYEIKEESSYFFELKRSVGNRFIKYYSYHKSNLSLREEGQSFSEMPIGIRKVYDEKGTMIKEINYDEDYSFSVTDLISKLKKEKQIDLNEEKYIVMRHLEKGKPYYFIRYPFNKSSLKYIKIDGSSGEIIFDKFLYHTE
ncbi:hypothetical protein [Flavobacterium beibuense]|uniref:hypothetical protein n=1 Tax=Flavobacterium beibuense TaxID=657326 RepID=UPI003A934B0F